MGAVDKLKKRGITLTFCHQLPERSFFISGKQFPVCARCTGVIAGMLMLPVFHLEIIRPTILLALLFTIPLVADGTTQALGGRKSNNTLRFVTGLLFGMAQAACIVVVGKTLAYSFMKGYLVYLQSHIT
jgi:uncharacterized membrane protein